MCGIVGYISNKPVHDKSFLQKANDKLIHRGPDGAGIWWSDDNCIGLGHRRLAIIDLSEGGQQPMSDYNKELTIVFNGEIYNYQDIKTELIKQGYIFRTKSDTEVILNSYKCWGVNCLEHLNGMFAFVIYDNRNKKAFVARDRAGEKPFFYTLNSGSLLFASELKALMSYENLDRKIDIESLDCYLSMGYIPGDKCILKGVSKLPPAHAMEYSVETGQIHIWKYWQLPQYAGTNDTSNEIELLNQLEFLLEDSVSKQLIADVPVGVLLSGGVDSSLVTAMAVRSTSKVKTFTIRFPGHIRFDETEHARMIAKHFQTEHIELDALQSTFDLMPLLARQFDEPIIDSSMIPTFLVSKLVREHCTVAIGGDGGDELFGGYGHYDRLLWMQKKFKNIPHFLRDPLALIAESILPVGFKGKNWLQSLSVDLENGLPLIASYFDKASRRKLINSSVGLTFSGEIIRNSRIPSNKDLLQRATRMDFENYLPEDILVKVDRASMLNSLEIRAPFLDYRLIEFAYRNVPSFQKTTPGSKKILLKKLCTRILPSEFDKNRKQGFSIPLESWLKNGPWLEYFKEVLLGSDDVIFNRKSIEGLLNGQLNGRSNSERLFSLVLLELWRKEYNITF